MPDNISTPPILTETQFRQKAHEALKRNAVRDILGTALVAGGLTGAVRGGQGLFNLFARGGKKVPTRAGITPLSVSYRSPEDEEEKYAYDPPISNPPTTKGGLGWYWPLLIGGGGLGAYGGWKGVDALLDQRRKGEIDDEVADARREFEEALSSQYKRGSDSKLGIALDELHDKMQKMSEDASFIERVGGPNAKGYMTGAYSTYAIPSALLSYLFVKGMADKRSRRSVLDKAIQQRALKHQRARPSELYVVPHPVSEEEE
jgi:hypothetical protein